MLAELRSKSQLTIPKEIVDTLNMSEGDKLEIYVKDGIICMMPVVVYPKGYVDKLLAEVEELKIKIAAGEQPLFDSVDELISCLESED